MIISISGDPGSGKSTVAKRLAKELGLDFYYVGGLRREMAAKRKMTLEEYNKLGETDPKTDFEADEYAKELGKTKNNFIIDGRLAWHFVPMSFKIFLSVDGFAGAERVWKELQNKNERNEGRHLETIEDVLKAHHGRKRSDDMRYKKYYNVNAFDHKNFDFVLDTTKLNPEEAYQEVLKAVNKHKTADADRGI